MFKKIFQASVVSTAVLMYLRFEYALFAELGWQGGLLDSFFFTAFAVAGVAGLMYHPPRLELEEPLDEDAHCLP